MHINYNIYVLIIVYIYVQARYKDGENVPMRASLTATIYLPPLPMALLLGESLNCGLLQWYKQQL